MSVVKVVGRTDHIVSLGGLVGTLLLASYSHTTSTVSEVQAHG